MTREFDQYKQSDDILRRMHDVPLIAVIGPTRAGKTTLMEYARSHNPNLHFVVSDVSRLRRPNEIEGVHYYFQERQVMEAKARAGLYATVAESVTGDLYATAPDEYDQYGQPIMAVISSVIPVFRKVFPAMRTIVILPPSLEVWIDRDENRNQQTKRMAEAIESLTFAAADKHSFYVINDDLRSAQAEFMQLVQRELTSVTGKDRQTGQELARELLNQIKLA